MPYQSSNPINGLIVAVSQDFDYFPLINYGQSYNYSSIIQMVKSSFDFADVDNDAGTLR